MMPFLFYLTFSILDINESHSNISANYLHILCKKNIGISATQLIQQRVLPESKRLLQSTCLSIKEIAFELGFVDQANFFKSQAKVTPIAFRQN